MTDTGPLWVAVDRLTKPSRVQVQRATDAEWLADSTALITQIQAGRRDGACSVAAYRAAAGMREAATTRWATVPSLWDQSTVALTGGEIGGGDSKPLRERSPADLDLMEIRALIRDTTRHELEARGAKTGKYPNGERVPFQQTEMRALAVLVGAEPDGLWWWVYRFDQWGRLLETYLHAAEHHPNTTRLRNTACPECAARHATVETEDGMKVVPALCIDFTSDGYVRAAECSNCGHAWFRGREMERLAEQVGCSISIEHESPASA